MSPLAPNQVPASFRRYRLRLFGAMAAVVVALTVFGLYFAERGATASAARQRQDEFHATVAHVRSNRQMRVMELARRCDLLARKSRIHAALEDDALDLLYLSSRDELQEVLAHAPDKATDPAAPHAVFCRYLDANGAVIAPEDPNIFGRLSDAEIRATALPRLPGTAQLGYLIRGAPESSSVIEVIATPIFGTKSRQPIAALVVGFALGDADPGIDAGAVRRGIWAQQRLSLAAVPEPVRAALQAEIGRSIATPAMFDPGLRVDVGGEPCLVLCQALNEGSKYPPAFEVCLYPLQPHFEALSRIRRSILGGGVVVLLGALGLSQVLASRMSRPVESLAIESERNAFERTRAQAALETTQAELQRAARFSANASHQLKTPVAVLRAGLDELLARGDLPAEVREELHALAGTTMRFSGMIDDLLLLSRMDAGRLRIDFRAIDLALLVAAALDDLSVLPDPFGLLVEKDMPEHLGIYGEQRYVAHILHNLLENAGRYNRPDGRILVRGRTEGRYAVLTIGNTGKPIPLEVQPSLFERFHRGGTAEDIPGHGLGLNLARDLARLHHGDIRFRQSTSDWTEFEVTFQTTASTPPFPVPR